MDTSEISKAYEPQAVEAKWYQYWLDRQCFVANPERVSARRPAYSIVIPPPNVTGVLTMGHVLNNTLQDILARKARMDGKEVLWLPGTDHAGIATQTVVERTLKKQGAIKHRDDLGREKFLEKVWEWKEKHGGIIIDQLKKLGASCDWTRERFTMDPDYSRCVQKVFVDLYAKGLIYRGKRMVNWCPVSLTALSDEEVIMKEQKGFLYYFKVEVAEEPGTWLTIATTRPETIPADTAVAVNPKDPRYAPLIGKHVRRALPLENQALIPIIGDDQIDIEFGTGVLKVTPAHDKADYEIYQRILKLGAERGVIEWGKMKVIEVISPHGTMTAEAGKDLAGLDRFVARKKAAEILEAAGAMAKVEPYVNNVGFSERADVPVEPRLSEQWFLKYPSVEQARACVEPPEHGGIATSPGAAGTDASEGVTTEGAAGEAPAAAREGACAPRMRFFPDRWARVYDHWMGGIQDWCISRQLWWGHRIPVWTKMIKLTPDNWTKELLEWGWDDYVGGNWNRGTWPATTVRMVRMANGEELDLRRDSLMPVVNSTEGEYRIAICTASAETAALLEAHGFTQDPDVLDTWFSSWLWPFATMGWTGDVAQDSTNPTLKAFYPTTDLVTGPDIIFFWVARMIMAGYEYMGDLPFRNVYFTGIIRDKHGHKMSKSLGNSPDPLGLIKGYGADAVRFGIIRSIPQGQDLIFEDREFEKYGKEKRYDFENQEWNPARFPQLELARNFCNKLWNACRFRQMQGGALEGEIDPKLLTSDDKWILRRLDLAIRELDDAFANYRFAEATATLYRFFWSEYCDWYVEASKAALRPAEGGVEGSADGDPLNASAARLRANKLAVIDFVLSHTLRLFHPFLPFITEELWQGMGYHADLPADQGGSTIMFAHWPKPFDADFQEHFGLDESAEKLASAKYELVGLGRNLRREFNLPATKKLRFVLKPAGAITADELEVIRLLLNAEHVDVDAGFQPTKGTPVVSNALGELFLPLEGLIDFAAERTRLAKELEKARAELGKVEAKLANPNFTQKVPAPVLEEHQKRKVEWETKLRQAEAALANLPSV